MSEARLAVRCIAAAVFLVLAMAGLAVRLAFLHMGPHDTPKRRVELDLMAKRGTVYDGSDATNVLALNLLGKSVIADPQEVASNRCEGAVASNLAAALDLPYAEVVGKLDRTERRYVPIKRFVNGDSLEAIRRRRLPGVFCQDASVRFYPHGSFMCHVLGFVNYEGDGSAGVELAMDSYLRGSSGFVQTEVNAKRLELYDHRGRVMPPLDGANVTLTIDQNVQHIIEAELDRLMAEHRAKGAWAIVERVQTGEILAMASRPGFDLNEYGTAGQERWLNRAIGYVYEPGSTMKAATISAALNERTVTPDTVFDCENGAWPHMGKILRDFHPYGRLTVADGIKKSSNILAAKVSLTLGPKRLHDYLRRFGVGAPLGVDLPGEEGGILSPVSRWSGISGSRIAIGQGVAVTALQMLGVYASIANNGVLMRPYVVKEVKTADGASLYRGAPRTLAQPISAETAATMRRLLGRVTEEGGTGYGARVDGYTVAGKTGTAQKPVNGVYSSTLHWASFVGFLPVDRPQIALIVVVDEPQPYHTGGIVAGPTFGRIAGQVVRYLDIPPSACELARGRPESRGAGNVD